MEKSEAQVDWAQGADAIVRRIRAFDPAPGATTALDGETVKLWAAAPNVRPSAEAPGTVLSAGPSSIVVAASGSDVTLTELQRAGGKRLPVADFLRGFDVKAGQVFG